MNIDLSQAMEAVDGDKDLLRELISDFLGDYPEQMEGLWSGLENGDADQVERRAHSLKSNIGIFGAREAYNLALELEERGRESRLDGAASVFEQLESGLKGVASYFSSGAWEANV